MSAITFKKALAISPIEAMASYSQESYSLHVVPDAGLPTLMHRTSIESLTLSLRPKDHVLVALDAYTNQERWERRQLTLPEVDQESAVICTDSFDEHGIGRGDSGTLSYNFSEDASLLHIDTGRGGVSTRIRCLSCIVCGLGIEGELIEIWVQGLRFDGE
jgi:hypothetical protein